MSNIIKGSITEGFDLTLIDAKKLHAAGLIAKPTLNALKNYFVTNILVPQLRELKAKHVTTDSPNEISGLRKYIGRITIANNPVDLKQLNKNFLRLETGDITQSQILDLTNPGRRDAATGLSGISRQTADFWNELQRLSLERQEAIQFANPNELKRINKQFDRDMKRLFKLNRRILPKVNNKPIEYDFNKLSQYGWREGRSEEGYLKWQKEVYKIVQDQSRAIAQELGFTFDAGHALSLGGISITKEELSKLPIDLQELIIKEGKLDPDNEGNYLLRGTNSASNLAVELAKLNRSKGKSITRNLKDLLELNIAFTKSQSLAEYNLIGDNTFRKNTDFNNIFRSMLVNSGGDINAILAQAEQRLNIVGNEKAAEIGLSQRNIKNVLNPVTHTSDGLLKTEVYNKAGSLLSKRVDFDEQLVNQSQTIWDEQNQGLDALQSFAEQGLEYSINAAGALAGKPDLGSNLRRIVDVGRNIYDEDYLNAGINSLGFLRQSSIEKIPPNKWKSKNYFLNSAK